MFMPRDSRNLGCIFSDLSARSGINVPDLCLTSPPQNSGTSGSHEQFPYTDQRSSAFSPASYSSHPKPDRCSATMKKNSTIYRYPFSSLGNKDIINAPLSQQEKNAIRKILNIKEPQMILAVGQFIHRKGFDVLLQAARTLNQSDTGVPSGNFSCAKDGRHRKAVVCEAYRMFL